MRAPAASAIFPILLLAESLVIVAACVPRPAGPARASATAGVSAGVTSGAVTTSPAAPTGPTGPPPIPSFVRPTPLPAPTFLAYTVKPGDTLTSIARFFGTTPRSIAFWSRAEHPSLDPVSSAYRPDRLEVGWVLMVIPDAVFDEDELPDATPSPGASASGEASPGPTAS